MFNNPIILWLVLGGILLGVDKLQNRWNLMYAAYSAFTVSAFLILGILRNPDSSNADFYIYFVVGQAVFFCIGIVMWWFALRDKPKSKLSDEEKEFYRSIVGKTVIAGANGINSVSGGEVIFAGKSLPAKLAAGEDLESVESGAKMLVQEVVDTTLIVVAKN